MSQERFTLLITSNKRLNTWAFGVSKLWIYTIGLGLLALAAVMIFVVFDYGQLLVKESRHEYIKEQNIALKKQVKEFSAKMEVLQVDLEKVNRFSRKLKIITLGENESDRQLELGLGKPLIEEGSAKRSLASVGSTHAHSHTEKTIFPLFKKSTEEYVFMNPLKEADLTLVFKDVAVSTKKVERDLTLLFEKIASKRDLLSATPSIRPTGGWLSSGFGYRRDPFTKKSKLHKGLDFAANTGTPVYAPADGVVSFAGREGGYGKIVSIDHGYGIVTRYAHNSRLAVKTGQQISRWDKIAEVGSTGRSSGPHLHYEVRVNGVPVNPENYLLSN